MFVEVTMWVLLNVIGWAVLTTSWILPRFIKDEMDKKYWGSVLSAFALGFFVSSLIVNFVK